MTKLPKSLEDKMEKQAAIPNEKLINRLEEVIWKDGVHFGALEVKALADRILIEALEFIKHSGSEYWKCDEGFAMNRMTEKLDSALAEWTALWGEG